MPRSIGRSTRLKNAKRYAKIKADPQLYAEKLQAAAKYTHLKLQTDPAWRAAYLDRKARWEKARNKARKNTIRQSDVSQTINPALRDSTYAALYALVGPRHPERDDLISEAMVKLLEGEAATPAEALKLGSREHYRKFADRHRLRSLDEKSKRTGMCLYDVIGA